MSQKKNQRNAQEVADFFNLYLARDSNKVWHAFKGEPILKSKKVFNDDGEEVLVGYWKMADDSGAVMTFFENSIYDRRTFDYSLTRPGYKKPGQNNKKPNQENNKKSFNKNRNFNDNHSYNNKEKPNKGMNPEVSDTLKRLFD